MDSIVGTPQNMDSIVGVLEFCDENTLRTAIIAEFEVNFMLKEAPRDALKLASLDILSAPLNRCRTRMPFWKGQQIHSSRWFQDDMLFHVMINYRGFLKNSRVPPVIIQVINDRFSMF